ncbi:hypothetical protein ASE31_28485 [Acidovorax sp. Root217]|nr:hypothetical protein ASE31_28485 [Acidovorax sp. Root217]
MASRALMARLRMALSNWFSSHSVVHRSGASCSDSSTFSPMVWRSRSCMDSTSGLARTALGLSGWRREKASSRCVSPAAREVDARARVT